MSDYDLYWDKCSFAMHADGTAGSKTLVDEKGATLTAYGSTQIISDAEAFGGSCARLGLSGSYNQVDHIHVNNPAPFAIPAGPFTFDMRVKHYGFGAYWGSFLIDTRSTTSGDAASGWSLVSGWSGDANRFSFSTNVSNKYIRSIAAPLLNVFQHIRIVRDESDVIMMFVDGVKQTETVVHSGPMPATVVKMGSSSANDSTTGLSGCIEEVQLWRGVALTTSNFVPPTSAFPDQGPACDPYWNQVVLASHFNGTAGSADITIEKYATAPALNLNNYGCVYSSAQSLAGGTSLFVDGAAKRLEMYTPAFEDYTAEAWFWLNAGTKFRLARANWRGDYFDCAQASDGVVYACGVNTGISPVIPTGQWVHIRQCRNYSTATGYFFVNGVKLWQGPCNNAKTDVPQMQFFGTHDIGSTSGYVQDWLITGVCKSISDFTPPTAPFYSIQCGEATKPTLTVSSPAFTESASAASVVVSISAPAAGDVTFSYATSSGSAGASDFEATSGSGTIPAGSTSTSISVIIKEDAYAEGTETFTFTVSNVSPNVELVGSNLSGVVSILEDVLAEQVTLSLTGPASILEGAPATYTLSLSGSGPVESFTVNVQYSGTSAESQDYIGVSSVTFGVGETTKQFSVITQFDELIEGTEYLNVAIQSLTGTGGYENLVASGIVSTAIGDIPPKFIKVFLRPFTIGSYTFPGSEVFLLTARTIHVGVNTSTGQVVTRSLAEGMIEGIVWIATFRIGRVIESMIHHDVYRQLADAPMDGSSYVRKDGAWAALSSGPTTYATLQVVDGVVTIPADLGSRFILYLQEDAEIHIKSFDLAEGVAYEFQLLVIQQYSSRSVSQGNFTLPDGAILEIPSTYGSKLILEGVNYGVGEGSGTGWACSFVTY